MKFKLSTYKYKLPVNALLPPLFWKFFYFMTTIYECLQKYYSRKDSVKLSKKSLHSIYNWCKYSYDKDLKNPPITFTKSDENGIIYNVRYYPNSFRPTIFKIIEVFHKKTVKYLQDGPPKKKDKLKEQIKCVRKRKRIIKPEFSAKPTL